MQALSVHPGRKPGTCRIKLASSAKPRGDLAHGETLLQGCGSHGCPPGSSLSAGTPRPRPGWAACVSPETRGDPECLLQEDAKHPGFGDTGKTVGSPTTDGVDRNTYRVLTPKTHLNQKLCDFLWLPEPVTTSWGA